MSYASYVSIDIKTTGLDPQTCQILEIGMVVEDWKTPVEDLPCLTFLVDPGVIVGEPYALQMNAGILRDIYELRGCEAPSRCGCGDMSKTEDAFREVVAFLSNYFPSKGGKVGFQVAGKNYAGFDRQFLERLPNWSNFINVHHRVLDPGSMYFDPSIDDGVPSTVECLRRAGLDPGVKHRALEDARDVIRLIRRRHSAKKLVQSQLDTETIIQDMRGQGYLLHALSTVKGVPDKYSVAFFKDNYEQCSECGQDLDPYGWNDYQHANTIEEAVRLAAEAVHMVRAEGEQCK